MKKICRGPRAPSRCLALLRTWWTLSRSGLGHYSAQIRLRGSMTASRGPKTANILRKRPKTACRGPRAQDRPKSGQGPEDSKAAQVRPQRARERLESGQERPQMLSNHFKKGKELFFTEALCIELLQASQVHPRAAQERARAARERPKRSERPKSDQEQPKSGQKRSKIGSGPAQERPRAAQ